MASIAFTFISPKVGVQSVSFNVKDEDMDRVYEAYKTLYVGIDDPFDEFVAENADKQPERPYVAEYTPELVLNRLAAELIYSIVSNVRTIETNNAIEKLNIGIIEVSDANSRKEP